MAKRFTDSLKYRKHFFRGLPGAYKLFYDFLYHDCDHAGIWIVDIETAQIFVGKDMPIEKERALKLFNTDEVRIVPFDGGKKWFIPYFIKFQYVQLSEKNRAHSAVINILKNYNLIDENLSPIEKLSPFEENPKPLWENPKGDKDMVKEKEKEQELEKDKEQEQAFGKSENLLEEKFIVPRMWDLWKKSFPKYSHDKKNDFPALTEIMGFMLRQAGGHDPTDVGTQELILGTFQQIANEVLKEPFWVNKPLKSIASHIQEFYNKIKNPINGTDTKQRKPGAKLDDDILKQKLAERINQWQQGGG